MPVVHSHTYEWTALSGARSGYPHVLFVRSGVIALQCGVHGVGGGAGSGGGGGGFFPQFLTDGRQPDVMWLLGYPPHVSVEEISQYHLGGFRRAPAP